MKRTSQYKLLKRSNSIIVNDLLIHSTIPVTLHGNLLTIRDIGEIIELKRDFMETITSKNYNVDHSSLLDKNLMYVFAKKLHFDVKAQSNKSTRDRSFIRLLQSPSIMVSVSGVSLSQKQFFLSSDPNELCNRLKLFLQ